MPPSAASALLPEAASSRHRVLCRHEAPKPARPPPPPPSLHPPGTSRDTSPKSFGFPYGMLRDRGGGGEGVAPLPAKCYTLDCQAVRISAHKLLTRLIAAEHIDGADVSRCAIGAAKANIGANAAGSYSCLY